MEEEDIEDKLDEYEDMKSSYKTSLRELNDGIQKVQNARTRDWISGKNRRYLSNYYSYAPYDKDFARTYRMVDEVSEVVDKIFKEYRPFSSESKKEAEKRAQRVEELLIELKEEIEDEVIPDIQESIDDLKRLEHELNAQEDVDRDDLNSCLNHNSNAFEDFVPNSEYDTELRKIEAEKEMQKDDDDFELMSLEEISYFIAEDVRKQIDVEGYDVEYVINKENMYSQHTEVIRNNLADVSNEKGLRNSLDKIHNGTEHIVPLKDSHKMYIIGRVFGGREQIEMSSLRMF